MQVTQLGLGLPKRRDDVGVSAIPLDQITCTPSARLRVGDEKKDLLDFA